MCIRDRLYTQATEIGKLIEAVDGVAEVDNGVEDTTPEIRVTVDKTKAMLKGNIPKQNDDKFRNHKPCNLCKSNGKG